MCTRGRYQGNAAAAAELTKQPGRWHSALCIAAEPVLVAAGAVLQRDQCNILPSYINTGTRAILTLSPQENSGFGSSCILGLRLWALHPLALLCSNLSNALESFGILLHFLSQFREEPLQHFNSCQFDLHCIWTELLVWSDLALSNADVGHYFFLAGDKVVSLFQICGPF